MHVALPVPRQEHYCSVQIYHRKPQGDAIPPITPLVLWVVSVLTSPSRH
jgi:hypothetical protein